jgi:serine/threonine protein phosphatase PrpC
MKFHHHTHSNIGRRSNNEDALVAAPEIGFYAVADGMGGYEGGEVASRVALESLIGYFERLGEGELDIEGDAGLAVAQMKMAVRLADRAVQRQCVGELSDMGTTIACLIVQGDRALIAHVGDSRVYQMREGELRLLTRDHSLVAELEAAGMIAASHLSHVITQALGHGPDAKPDVRVVDVLPGDRFLMCTDGLTDSLNMDEIGLELQHSKDAAKALVDLAYEMGSLDNITAVVVSAR